MLQPQPIYEPQNVRTVTVVKTVTTKTTYKGDRDNYGKEDNSPETPIQYQHEQQQNQQQTVTSSNLTELDHLLDDLNTAQQNARTRGMH